MSHDLTSRISLEGEDVCVCVGFCADDELPRWAGRIAASCATMIFCLYDSAKPEGRGGSERFAQTLERNLPSAGVRRRFFTATLDEWEMFHSSHKREFYGIAHLHVDASLPMPSSADADKPRQAPEALADFDDVAPLKDLLLKIVDVFSKSPCNGSWPSVLLLGDTGVGKTYAAQRIYDALVESGTVKARDDGGNFVSLNCGEFGQSDMNSALFGVEGGAFTDVRKDRPGAIKEAEDGVLFLDEIGTLPLDLQPRLLSVLDGGKYRVHGASKATETTKCRFIFGTNEDLAKAVLEGRFRFDLYNRISGIVVRIPSVKDRIAGHAGQGFLDRLVDAFCSRLGCLHLTKQARALFMKFAKEHKWRGNFRELNRSFQIMAMKSGRRGVVSAAAMEDVIAEVLRCAQSEDALNMLQTRAECGAHPLLDTRHDIPANEKAMLLFAFDCAAKANNCQDAGRSFFAGKRLRNWNSSFSRYLARFGFQWNVDSNGHVSEI